jgi:uncharacterized protein with FMN-binding domain
MLKKVALSLAVILGFIFFSYTQMTGDKEDDGVVKLPDMLQPNERTSSSNKKAISGDNANITYQNGEYIGPVIDAYYGNVQVKAVIENGKLTDIVFMDYPHDRQTSERVNQQAMPYLRDEAIQAQSFEVDIVTGATQTSLAFKKSLQGALEKAKI